MNFLHNFKTGFCCALRGVAEFYRRPEYLVYMIVPLILLLALYGIAVWGRVNSTYGAADFCLSRRIGMMGGAGLRYSSGGSGV